MTKNFRFILGVLIIGLLTACGAQEKFKTGNNYHGFKLVEKKFVKEVDAECLYFIHEKSGARLFKIMNNDANKLFSIGFKTIPENDCGTPHIIEHSVLNGSKNFPVKSPFDLLSQGSLNTFLNAMTNSDWTVYPVASMNDKDYFNLMHVYLDAVFNPLIYSDKRIFMQEGWHHEMMAANTNVEYKGVVYNEMKGAFSNPLRELGYHMGKLLFPDNGYGFESGGYPTAIPQLTYESFLNFHRKYYHPSNSYILLYGNADLNKELAFIDANYLANYEKSKEEVTIPLQKPFTAMKTEVRPYPVTEGENTQSKTYLSLSFVSGLNTDRVKTQLLSILADALVNNEQGAIRRALQDAGIGSEVSAYVDETQQNVFTLFVLNANENDQQKFNETVFSTLKKVAAEGIDSSIINGIINRYEFSLREGNDSQKGLMYYMRMIPNWYNEQNPFKGLEYEQYLADIKAAVKSGELQKMITSELVNNTHAVSLALVPKPGLQTQINKDITEELGKYKQTLSQIAIDSLVKTTNELIAYQKREDADSLIAKIPMLSLGDIGKESEFNAVEEKKAGKLPVLHSNQFSNGIVYTSLFFDTRVLNTSDVPYIKLLCTLTGMLPTESYTFGELENQLNTHTGGFSISFNSYLKNSSDDELTPKVKVTCKAMRANTDRMLGLIEEILTSTKYNDTTRIKELLIRQKAELEYNLQQNGLGVAQYALFSSFSNEGHFLQAKNGLPYYRFICNLTDNFYTQKDSLMSKLQEVATKIFNSNNLIAAVTCNNDDYSLFEKGISQLIGKLHNEPVALTNWKFNIEKKNEGILSTSKVQYVLQGANFKKLGYEWNGKIEVLQQLLSTDYLQNQIRVIGGAYGGFSRFNKSGNMFFGSYRDPNLVETLQAYSNIPGYLDSLNIDEKTLTRFIIGTIANIDVPMTVSEKGEDAFRCYLEGMTKDQVQKDRTEILSTTLADLKAFKPMMEAILKQNNYAVFGNEEKLQANKQLFDALEKVTQ
jgi:Zn-dependent M16 (insulinase) family peptidase